MNASLSSNSPIDMPSALRELSIAAFGPELAHAHNYRITPALLACLYDRLRNEPGVDFLFCEVSAPCGWKGEIWFYGVVAIVADGVIWGCGGETTRQQMQEAATLGLASEWGYWPVVKWLEGSAGREQLPDVGEEQSRLEQLDLRDATGGCEAPVRERRL